MTYTGKSYKTICQHVKAGHFTCKDGHQQGKRLYIDQDSIIAHYLPGLKLPKKKA